VSLALANLMTIASECWTEPMRDVRLNSSRSLPISEIREDLCSPHEMTDALIDRIARVIFESHPVSEQDGALNFMSYSK